MTQASNSWADQAFAKVKQSIIARKTADQAQIVDKLLPELERLYHQHSGLLENYEKFGDKLQKANIDCFETLTAEDVDLTDELLELAKNTDATKMPGNNFACFGLTATGKSTILNQILGQNAAETGPGETTKNLRPYAGTNFFIWDTPGRNDEVSYMSMGCISFWKALSRRLIVIQSTVKENSSLMKLMDAIGLNYSIVVNKIDRIDENHRQKFFEQIRHEVITLGLKRVDGVFFISAEHPDMSPDWKSMVSYLTSSIE